MPRSTPHWLRSKGTPGASAVEILAKISFRRRPAIRRAGTYFLLRGQRHRVDHVDDTIRLKYPES